MTIPSLLFLQKIRLLVTPVGMQELNLLFTSGDVDGRYDFSRIETLQTFHQLGETGMFRIRHRINGKAIISGYTHDIFLAFFG
jgi:hypothetical protein